MGKWAYALMKLFKLASDNPEGFGAFIVWLISAIIGILIVALIVGGIAKLIGKDFEEWFAKGLANRFSPRHSGGEVVFFSVAHSPKSR